MFKPSIIRHALATLILTLFMSASQAASASDFDQGRTAYDAGDYETAISKWLPLAEQGDVDAQYNLGTMYGKGRGVPQDDAAAVTWYRRAAEQGLARAQYNLGFVYVRGQGVPQDDATAVTWFRRAAEQGHARAQNSLGIMYEKGWGVLQDDVASVTWYRRAAEQGLADAQYGLGIMYSSGRGVPQDFVLAYMWFSLATRTDGETGKRDRVARQMNPAQIARAQSLAAQCLASDYQDCGE